MYKHQEIVDRVNEIFPNEKDRNADFRFIWIPQIDKGRISIRSGDLVISTYLEQKDLKTCLDQKACIGMYAKIAQLKARMVEIKNMGNI